MARQFRMRFTVEPIIKDPLTPGLKADVVGPERLRKYDYIYAIFTRLDEFVLPFATACVVAAGHGWPLAEDVQEVDDLKERPALGDDIAPYVELCERVREAWVELARTIGAAQEARFLSDSYDREAGFRHYSWLCPTGDLVHGGLRRDLYSARAINLSMNIGETLMALDPERVRLQDPAPLQFVAPPTGQWQYLVVRPVEPGAAPPVGFYSAGVDPAGNGYYDVMVTIGHDVVAVSGWGDLEPITGFVDALVEHWRTVAALIRSAMQLRVNPTALLKTLDRLGR